MSIAQMRRSALLLLIALLLAVVGCSARTTVESDLGLRHAPDWVNRGSQALSDRNGRYIHGVGSAPMMSDASLQSATADTRARAEVARVLSTYMDVAVRDYTAQAGSQAELAEHSVSRQIDSLTRVNMNGVRIIARWRDSRSGALYSLAELDMQRVKATVAAVEDMNSGLRDHLRGHGDNIFDAFARESQ